MEKTNEPDEGKKLKQHWDLFFTQEIWNEIQYTERRNETLREQQRRNTE